jgi:hypothetical protein
MIWCGITVRNAVFGIQSDFSFGATDYSPPGFARPLANPGSDYLLVTQFVSWSCSSPDRCAHTVDHVPPLLHRLTATEMIVSLKDHRLSVPDQCARSPRMLWKKRRHGEGLGVPWWLSLTPWPPTTTHSSVDPDLMLKQTSAPERFLSIEEAHHMG